MPYVSPPNWLDLALLGMVLGLLGTLIPFVPGLPIIVLCAVAYYTFAAGWSLSALVAVGVMIVLMVVGSTAEWWVAPASAQRGGGGCLSSFLAAIAGIVGFFVIPGIGVIVLPLVVVLVVEYLRARDVRHAGRATAAYFVGWLLSNGIELVAGLLMIGVFWWQTR